jgi:phenylacetate-CoA ligase
VKGVLLSPPAIEEVVRGIEGLGNEYEVIVDKRGDTDTIALKVEVLPGNENNMKRIETELKDQLRLNTNLAYKIEFHDLGTLPRYEVKARRFKDLRKGH